MLTFEHECEISLAVSVSLIDHIYILYLWQFNINISILYTKTYPINHLFLIKLQTHTLDITDREKTQECSKEETSHLLKQSYTKGMVRHTVSSENR